MSVLKQGQRHRRLDSFDRDVLARIRRLEGDAGADAVESSQVSPMQELDVLLSTDFGFDDGWGQVALDETLYAGGVRTQAIAAQDNWIAFPCFMGPKGSVWGVTLVHKVAGNYGQLNVEYATSDQDGLPGATGFEGEGFMQQPFDVTFVRPAVGVIQGYDPTPDTDVIRQRVALFRIGGDQGDVLTSFSVDPITGKPLGNGGPGLYWVRLYVSGKDASSSGFQFGLQYAAVERIPGG